MPGAKFFPDARLNYAENLLVKSDDTPALIFRGEDKVKKSMSWRELNTAVARLHHAFAKAGLKPGDPVAAHVPHIPANSLAGQAVASRGGRQPRPPGVLGGLVQVTEPIVDDRPLVLQEREVGAVDLGLGGVEQHQRADEVAGVADLVRLADRDPRDERAIPRREGVLLGVPEHRQRASEVAERAVPHAGDPHQLGTAPPIVAALEEQQPTALDGVRRGRVRQHPELVDRNRRHGH
jgi:hypothetical protein